MRVMITIDCDNLFEVTQHLQCLKEQIKKAWHLKTYAELENKTPPEGVKTILKDSNCYGEHRAVFTINK